MSSKQTDLMIRMPSRRRQPVITSIAIFAATMLMAIRVMSTGNSFVMTKAGSTLPLPLKGGTVFPASPSQLLPQGHESPSAFHCLGTLALMIGTFTASRRITTKSMPTRRQVQVNVIAQPKIQGQSYKVPSGFSKQAVLASGAASFADLFELDMPPMQAFVPVEAPSSFVGRSCPTRCASAAQRVGGRRHASSSRCRRHGFKSSTRSERRRIGCRLQAIAEYESAPASFDVSKVRTKIQLGLQHPRVDRGRESRSVSCHNGLMTPTESWVAISRVLLGLHTEHCMLRHTSFFERRSHTNVKKVFRIPGVV